MATPHVCPKCNGEKVVAKYWDGMSAGVESHRPCSTCNGDGVVWEPELMVIGFEMTARAADPLVLGDVKCYSAEDAPDFGVGGIAFDGVDYDHTNN